MRVIALLSISPYRIGCPTPPAKLKNAQLPHLVVRTNRSDIRVLSVRASNVYREDCIDRLKAANLLVELNALGRSKCARVFRPI